MKFPNVPCKMYGMDGRNRAALAVAARRGELGMTQADLAVKASVNVKTIGNLESRGRWPNAATRTKLEAALGWPPGTMAAIATSPEPEHPTATEEELWQKIDELYEAARARRGNGRPKAS